MHTTHSHISTSINHSLLNRRIPHLRVFLVLGHPVLSLRAYIALPNQEIGFEINRDLVHFGGLVLLCLFLVLVNVFLEDLLNVIFKLTGLSWLVPGILLLD